MLRVSSEDRPWWDTRAYAAVLIALAALPLLWPAIPPLGDLPGHLANYHIAEALPRSPELQRYFSWQWHLIGNLGANIAMVPMGKIFGIELGAKALTILIAMASAAGFLAIAKVAHGRLPATAALSIPLIYNYPFHYGFLNYSFAMALTCLSYALWLRMLDVRAPVRRTVIFFLLASLVWLCHAIAWALLLLICASAEVYRLWLVRRTNPLIEVLRSVGRGLALLGPVLVMLANRGVASSITGFLEWRLIAIGFATVLRDRWIVADLLSIVALYLLLLAVMLRVGRLGFRAPVLLAAIGMGLVYVAAPQSMDGTAFLGVRIIAFVVAFAVLAIDTGRLSRRSASRLAMASLAFVLLRIGANTVSFGLYDRAYAANLRALDVIPRGATVASFVPLDCPGTRSWMESRLNHLPAMVVVRRDGFVNSMWTLAGVHPLTVHYPAAGAYQFDPSESVTLSDCGSGATPPLRQAIAHLPRAAFDFVWLLDTPPAAQPRPPWLVPVWRGPDAVLYRVAKQR